MPATSWSLAIAPVGGRRFGCQARGGGTASSRAGKNGCCAPRRHRAPRLCGAHERSDRQQTPRSAPCPRPPHPSPRMPQESSEDKAGLAPVQRRRIARQKRRIALNLARVRIARQNTYMHTSHFLLTERERERSCKDIMSGIWVCTTTRAQTDGQPGKGNQGQLPCQPPGCPCNHVQRYLLAGASPRREPGTVAWYPGMRTAPGVSAMESLLGQDVAGLHGAPPPGSANASPDPPDGVRCLITTDANPASARRRTPRHGHLRPTRDAIQFDQ
jgi:hypothetical protein